MSKLIVGLGNPGEDYEYTYHNLGFMALDRLAVRLGKKINKSGCSAEFCVFSKGKEQIILAKPQTFMNLSGIAVKGLMVKYNVAPGDVVIMYDDIDLPRLTVRARRTGSAGTHNGMKSVLGELGTADIPRIRIGAGRGLGDLAGYVLSKIPKDDREGFEGVFENITDRLVEFLANGDFDALMRKLNS